MKRLLLILLTVASLSASAADDHIETGEYRTKSGATVLIVYALPEHTVYLFLPDGRRVGMAYEPGTPVATLDRGICKLAEAETAP